MSLYKMISSKILENSQGTFWKINLASSLLLFAQCMLSTLCNVLVDPFPLHRKQVEDGQLGLVNEDLYMYRPFSLKWSLIIVYLLLLLYSCNDAGNTADC